MSVSSNALDSPADYQLLPIFTDFHVFCTGAQIQVLHLTIRAITLWAFTAKHCSKLLHMLINSILTILGEQVLLLSPVFMWENEVQKTCQSHTTSDCLSWDLNPDGLALWELRERYEFSANHLHMHHRYWFNFKSWLTTFRIYITQMWWGNWKNKCSVSGSVMTKHLILVFMYVAWYGIS